jgi:hypothetical protein
MQRGASARRMNPRKHGTDKSLLARWSLGMRRWRPGWPGQVRPLRQRGSTALLTPASCLPLNVPMMCRPAASASWRVVRDRKPCFVLNAIRAGLWGLSEEPGTEPNLAASTT